MRLENVKVGMHLHDPKGNVWEIVDEPNLTGIPTFYARCIEFRHPVGVMPQYTVDTEAKARVGRHLWVDKKHLIVAPDSVIEQFKDYLSSADTIKVVTGLNKTAILRFVTQEQYDNVEVTLESLEPIPKTQHLTRENIRVGMRVRTALGTELIVIGVNDTAVQLLLDVNILCSAKQLKQVSAEISVAWADAPTIPVGALTTNDFTVVE